MYYTDVPLLYAAGFTQGIAECLLWGKDKEGQEYQAVVSDGFITLGKRLPSGLTESHKRMSRSKFHQLFGD